MRVTLMTGDIKDYSTTQLRLQNTPQSSSPCFSSVSGASNNISDARHLKDRLQRRGWEGGEGGGENGGAGPQRPWQWSGRGNRGGEGTGKGGRRLRWQLQQP